MTPEQTYKIDIREVTIIIRDWQRKDGQIHSRLDRLDPPIRKAWYVEKVRGVEPSSQLAKSFQKVEVTCKESARK